MSKRLMEIFLYILDHGGEGGEAAVGLDEVKDWLEEAGFSSEEIRQAMRYFMQSSASLQEEAAGDDFDPPTLNQEAWDFLEKIQHLGLLWPEEFSEILRRAASMYPEGLGLEEIRFLTASLIFDRDLMPASLSNRLPDSIH
ncbi:MAG: DUF494 family protein [Candidatus Krumholzibacteria bacterium]|jgi:uncharacterized protein Smg (DUF494 family)|nr:DUF494 family protein [Candidatus Krumholzibacteria bacterium]MDP6668792.1 DUF494 family protein [Candidatus Krumholzibacteria bacterium]MDP6796798.1 DUF494 family protein [Candidatus Krumholzibacteria bacterium]MDP7020919.1 DUF494 family protein [Candidatus Krumholzibacteria bacterium]